MQREAVVVPVASCAHRESATTTGATPPGSGFEPIDVTTRAARSAWTMPSFYLVPLMCAYIFGAMWIIRGVSHLCRMASYVWNGRHDG